MLTLRDTIEAARMATGASLNALTVLSAQVDPYRIDTPAHRRDAEWLRDAWEESGARRPMHLRGVFYALISMNPAPFMPNGRPFLNTHKNWLWLESVGNRARWLGMIPFEWITDNRNAAPIINAEREGCPELVIGSRVHQLALPGRFDDLLPVPAIRDFGARQAYKLMLIGEKSSLADVLAPLAEEFSAEMVLPTGELSTTLLHGCVERARNDGRPARIFYLADFDPAGYTMPVNTARKLQAFLNERRLDIQLRRLALTADQVHEFGLPSTPLKESERRAARWRERFGCEQTEIDALATLRPGVLRDIVRTALEPYYDADLGTATRLAEAEAVREAATALGAAVAGRREELADARRLFEAARKAAMLAYEAAAPLFAEIAEEVAAGLELPAPPEAQCDGDVAAPWPLFDSRRTWVEQTVILREEQL